MKILLDRTPFSTNKKTSQNNKQTSFMSRSIVSEFKKASKSLRDIFTYNETIPEADTLNELIENYTIKNKAFENTTKLFEEINKCLDRSNINNYYKDFQITTNFTHKMEALPPNKGFNRIAGYQDIKDTLMRNFIIKSVMMSKTSQNASVPNAVLFYGPTGNGKTTFAKALAEQSLSEFNIIDCGQQTPQETNKLLNMYLDNAKKTFQASGDEKTRTIVVLNEAETVLNEKSPVYNEIAKKIPTISKDYATTLFLTSNFPRFINKELFKQDLTPLKIGIKPADFSTAKDLIKQTIENLNKKFKDFDELTKLFFKEDNLYSNGKIKNTVLMPFKFTNEPNLDDFSKTIQSSRPSITQTDIKQFEEDIKYFDNI